MSAHGDKPGEDLARMQCMEIWGGNHATSNSFRATGLDIFVNCSPYGESLTGGDIYYLTSCASGQISRLMLLDVAGHGKAVTQLAIAIRDLLRTNVNRASQKKFVESMNREFTKAGVESFATAIVASYFAPRRLLSLSVAGHPNPIYYSASAKHWSIIDRHDKNEKSLSNIPIGISEAVEYPGYEVAVSSGDMFLMYSDAFIESIDQNGQQIGIDGIRVRLNQLGSLEPDAVIPNLIQSIKSEAAENLTQDDATVILGRFTRTKARWQDNLLAPFRLFGNVRDRTAFNNSRE